MTERNCLSTSKNIFCSLIVAKVVNQPVIVLKFYLALINEKGKIYPDTIFSFWNKICSASVPKVYIFPFPADEARKSLCMLLREDV